MDKSFDAHGFANAWNTHSIEKIVQFYADDAELIAPPNPESHRGKEGVRRAIRETLEGIPDVNGDIAWSIQQKDRVALLVHITGRHTGPLVLGPGQTIPASGKSVRFELGSFIELDNEGKIRRETQIADVASLLMQVGVLGEGATAATGSRSMPRSNPR